MRGGSQPRNTNSTEICRTRLKFACRPEVCVKPEPSRKFRRFFSRREPCGMGSPEAPAEPAEPPRKAQLIRRFWDSVYRCRREKVPLRFLVLKRPETFETIFPVVGGRVETGTVDSVSRWLRPGATNGMNGSATGIMRPVWAPNQIERRLKQSLQANAGSRPPPPSPRASSRWAPVP